eukprot:13313496-Alexandrium_andersonii.AAC.1
MPDLIALPASPLESALSRTQGAARRHRPARRLRESRACRPCPCPCSGGTCLLYTSDAADDM